MLDAWMWLEAKSFHRVTVAISGKCVPALDVKELLSPNVGPKASLGDDEAPLPGQLERDLIGQNGGVAVRDVGKGPRVHHHGCAL